MLSQIKTMQAIGGLGVTELLICLAIVLLVFGATKLPQLGDALGKSIRNFKKATSAPDDSIDVTPPSLESPPEAAQTVQVEEPQEHQEG